METPNQPKTSLETAENLPVCSFDCLVIVEPDPESYTPDPRDDNEPESIWQIICDQLDSEVEDNGICQTNKFNLSMDLKTPFVIWVRNFEDNYFECLTTVLSNVEFIYTGDDMNTIIPESLIWFLEALKIHKPNWKVCVIGGMYEDEVLQVARQFTSSGFDTTILNRYCMSEKGFINLDNFFLNYHKPLLEDEQTS